MAGRTGLAHGSVDPPPEGAGPGISGRADLGPCGGDPASGRTGPVAGRPGPPPGGAEGDDCPPGQGGGVPGPVPFACGPGPPGAVPTGWVGAVVRPVSKAPRHGVGSTGMSGSLEGSGTPFH
ncbi:hypothetical protein D0Q02_11460 [Micromonospora craniellae]|uniref:Uncharacterized protein n=1 Tax=Micromonospora craniellae TaxID=2294034 RepID=A0A372G0X1_9ACTN|nr:hypothetical protein D0Q02_11460 [Micromonospora craniellae]